MGNTQNGCCDNKTKSVQLSSKEKIRLTDAYGACCQTVVIWVLGNGERVVQGLEIDTPST